MISPPQNFPTDLEATSASRPSETIGTVARIELLPLSPVFAAEISRRTRAFFPTQLVHAFGLVTSYLKVGRNMTHVTNIFIRITNACLPNQIYDINRKVCRIKKNQSEKIPIDLYCHYDSRLIRLGRSCDLRPRRVVLPYV